MGLRKIFLALVVGVVCLFIFSCQTVDLYEKNTPIPKHEWSSSFKPQFKFVINDTSAPYQLYIVFRHNEKYNWNNIWLNMEAKMPGDTAQKFKIELPLATNNNGWLGSAMDDIYECRSPLTLDPARFNFQKSGEYIFTISQAMREDPLLNAMNIGLRVEKKQR